MLPLFLLIGVIYPDAGLDLEAGLRPLLYGLALGMVVLACLDLRKLYEKIGGRPPSGPRELIDFVVKATRITLGGGATVLVLYASMLGTMMDIEEQLPVLESPGLGNPETRTPQPRSTETRTPEYPSPGSPSPEPVPTDIEITPA
ncbi:hypothetical protein [Actinomadura sp. 7K507]|uniref:hypothetical protein n=1 Tax=Actinomadura sp. 7K507 TaxID=2530365 RepID=UPI0010489A31|nr:hypothetical protein [Actinomadura sp. 7K507]TDC78547.1 hypothetical protein E1285_37215 [Actinomadura sp. 7K507]